MESCQKVPKFDFQSQFSKSKIIWIFLIFFSLKNTNSGPHFLLLIKSIFKSLYLKKWCPIFDSSLIILNSKFNHFLWGCWFLCKNLSNFVPPAWKRHKPYCHNVPLSYKCSNFIAISLEVHDNKSPHVFITGWYWATGKLSHIFLQNEIKSNICHFCTIG